MRLWSRRNPDVALDGQAYALTVFTPIRPGHEPALRGVLEALGANGASPFQRVASTHFARFVVIDRLWHDAPELRPTLRYQYLLFSAVFDGGRDAYLAELCRRIPETVDAVWGRCLGAPTPVTHDTGPFTHWIRHNQVHTAAFFAPYGNATVADVRAALALRRRFERFALDHQYTDAQPLQQAFAATFVDPATGRLR